MVKEKLPLKGTNSINRKALKRLKWMYKRCLLSRKFADQLWRRLNLECGAEIQCRMKSRISLAKKALKKQSSTEIGPQRKTYHLLIRAWIRLILQWNQSAVLLLNSCLNFTNKSLISKVIKVKARMKVSSLFLWIANSQKWKNHSLMKKRQLST